MHSFILFQISKSLKTQTGQCTILKYAVLRRPGQICISKKVLNFSKIKNVWTLNFEFSKNIFSKLIIPFIFKKAVTQCAAGCQPSQPELLEKQIPFTCLKEDRVAERYVKKADRSERYYIFPKSKMFGH